MIFSLLKAGFIKVVFGSTLLFGALAFSQDTVTEVAVCDGIYANRNTSIAIVQQSVDCFRKLEFNEVNADRLATALSFVSVRTEDRKEKQAAIKSGLELITQMEAVDPALANVNYWKAVFLTFDAEDRDLGSRIPRVMFGRLGTIQRSLLAAMESNPTTHEFGPDRVYGIMYMSMPAIVGGNLGVAQTHLEKAFAGAPEFGENVVALARLLYRISETDRAKQILREYIARPLADFPERLRPDNQVTQQEAQKLLARWE